MTATLTGPAAQVDEVVTMVQQAVAGSGPTDATTGQP
jgi:hypothetical protein